MLGRILMQTGMKKQAAITGTATPSGTMTPNGLATPAIPNGTSNGLSAPNGNGNGYFGQTKEVAVYEEIDWYDPNVRNLVADGELVLPCLLHSGQNLIMVNSINIATKDLLPKCVRCVEASVR